MSKNPVVHFEMPYVDKQRASAFYTKAFGWNMVEYGSDMGDYIVAQTADTDEQGMVKREGAINGGLFPKKPDWPEQIPSVVISVDDIAKAMDDVRAAGGEVMGEPIDIPGIGLYVSFHDTEGNRVTLLQAHART